MSKLLSIFDFQSYRDFLKSTLEALKKKNPQFSLRSLAKRLEIPVSQLSEILNGKKDLNLEKSLNMSRLLKLSIRETTYFCYLVALESCSSEDQKEKLLEEMDLFKRNKDRVSIELDSFEVISQWECIAIFELVGEYPGQSSEFYATQIGISKNESERALESLLRVRFIRPEGSGFVKTTKEIFAASSNHNLAMKMYHSSMLERARRAIYDQSPATRYTGTETLMIDPELLPHAHQILNESLDRLVGLFQKSKNKSTLVHVNINLFELTKKKREVS